MQENIRPSSSSINSDAMVLDSNSSLHGYPDDENARFYKSLQELKDLRSQLRYAADYCEMSFMKGKEKKKVVENTKEYVCRAIVTVVDHIGSVSANLELQFSDEENFSDTELRITCLKQRLLTCQEYAQKLTLSEVLWNENFPRYNKHYISPAFVNQDKPKCVFRDSSVVSKTISAYKVVAAEEGSVMYTYDRMRSLRKLSALENGVKKVSTDSCSEQRVVPTLDSSFRISIPRNPLFHFQETKKHGRNERYRRMLQIPWKNKRTISRQSRD